MSWARLDDRMADHPKVAKCTTSEFAVYIRSILHCAGGLTDGRVARVKARLFFDYSVEGLTFDAIAKQLVTYCLWEVDGDDFVVKNYLEYNPSRAEVEAKREDTSAKRRAAANKRWANNGNSSEESMQTCKRDTNAMHDRNAHAMPHPIPSYNLQTGNLFGGGAGGTIPPAAVKPEEPPAAKVIDLPLPYALTESLPVPHSPKPPSRKPRKPRKPETECPPSGATDAEVDAWLESQGMPKLAEAGTEIRQFVDHHRARGNVFRDWLAAWRTWERNAVKFQRAGPIGRGSRVVADPQPATDNPCWEPARVVT